MHRALRALLVVGVCLLALGLAAATITDPTTTGVGGNGGSGGLGGGGVLGSEQNASGASGGGPPPIPVGTCVPALLTWQFKLGVLLATLLVGALLVYRYDWLTLVAVYGVLLLPGLVAYALLTNCGPLDYPTQQPPPVSTNVSSTPLPFTGNGSGGGGAVGAVSTPPALALLLVGAVLVLAVLLLRASGDTDATAGSDDPATTDDDAPDEETLTDVGRAAGAAADRIDDAGTDAENEVYRAWREMTALLDVPNPESSTPEEFAAAARDAGMAAEHVDTLTELFNDVRYGGAAVDDERARRARDALRAIEAAYGDDGGDGA
ncbi:hypothetical protein GCM10009037_15600 [Halarchaeum grantii]|uniref:Protein-glutamine gamma-glutamyltransferase-like C-terminal domain-containing protein n=1 Tax=Halarchaeum grantii TaxID=1193105 RepID=A0A830F1Z5_9EURY|nr:DUF4129 domain-containing protein [Halarchaeum grantii]GGL32801.1 hypothetical protein GCM10009037_15600 [Halarchaeum grantii]